MPISLMRLAAPLGAALLAIAPATSVSAQEPGLWRVYNETLKGAKYVDLTHTITPNIPVWAGFGKSAGAMTFSFCGSIWRAGAAVSAASP